MIAGPHAREGRHTVATLPVPNPSKPDEAPGRFSEEPFYTETLTLLRSVRDHDFETLAELCDDDFGIVDVDPTGASRPIRTRIEWEAWFHELFDTLDGMGAATDSEVIDYRGTVEDRLGFGVLEFRQTLRVRDLVATFDCVATIVWKRSDFGWREARWHASVISSDVPEGLMQSSD